MNLGSHSFRSMLLVGVLAPSLVGIACEHHSYRAYDPYYTDYHQWDRTRDRYYHRWAEETHRDRERDFPQAAS